MTLTVTSRGQVTFRREVLDHLGIKPGDKISLALLPAGVATLKAVERPGTIDSFIGGLAGRTRKKASLEEMNEAAREGWAGRE